MNARQPSSVYRPFSLSENAPAPVAAQVSIMLIWIRSNDSDRRRKPAARVVHVQLQARQAP